LTKAAAAFAEGLKSAQDKDVRERLHYSYGFALFKQQKYEGAAKTLAEQLSAVPGGELAGPARFLAAECLFHQDKFTEALPMFAQVAKDQVKPYHEQSLYRAGTCANNLRQWAVAGRHLKVLVDGFPKFDQLDDARYGLALALFKQSKPAEARAECAKIKGPGIAAAKARFLLGEMALAEKKYPEAIEFYFQVASSSADKSLRAESRYKAALCYHARGNKAAAIKQLERVVADHADHPRAKDAAKLIADLKQNP